MREEKQCKKWEALIWDKQKSGECWIFLVCAWLSPQVVRCFQWSEGTLSRGRKPSQNVCEVIVSVDGETEHTQQTKLADKMEQGSRRKRTEVYREWWTKDGNVLIGWSGIIQGQKGMSRTDGVNMHTQCTSMHNIHTIVHTCMHIYSHVYNTLAATFSPLLRAEDSNILKKS